MGKQTLSIRAGDSKNCGLKHEQTKIKKQKLLPKSIQGNMEKTTCINTVKSKPTLELSFKSLVKLKAHCPNVAHHGPFCGPQELKMW